MEKAKFIRALRNKNPFDRHAWEYTDLLYEYRGHKYIVTKYNNGYSSTDSTLPAQHRQEQARIDELIAHENDPIQEWKYEGSAQEGFDIFWAMVNE